MNLHVLHSVDCSTDGGIHLVVLSVRANELDEGPLHAVGKGDDQLVVVALDVEHHTVAAHDAGAAELRLHVRRAAPFRLAGHLVPSTIIEVVEMRGVLLCRHRQKFLCAHQCDGLDRLRTSSTPPGMHHPLPL